MRAKRRTLPPSAILLFAAGVMVALIAGGSYGLISSAEPSTVSYSLGKRPWLLPLSAERFGVVFENHGFIDGVETSAVYYGVVSEHGEWLSSPSPVTRPGRPAPPGSLGPAGITVRIDDGERVHIAWALWDSERDDLSFHYLQIDTTGSVRAETGPLASLALREIYSPILLGIRVLSDEVQIAFPVDGAYMVSTLDLAGEVKSAPYPVPNLENASFFPPRQFPPGVSSNSHEPIDSDASSVTDGTSTYYLWINGRQWFGGLWGRTYRSEQDLQFLRASTSGDVSRVLYSTEDTWWLSKPFVLPSFFSILGGASGFFVLGCVHLRRRKTRRF